MKFFQGVNARGLAMDNSKKANMSFLISSKQLIIRVLIRQILKNNGYKKYIFASNGQEASRKICGGEARVDFILSDWDMPLINGVELLKMVKNDPEHFIIPFVLLSPDSSILKSIYAMEEGAENYSSIPFTEESLMELIENCINDRFCESQEKTIVNSMVRNKLIKNHDKVIELGTKLQKTSRNQNVSILTGESLFHVKQYDRARNVLIKALKAGKNSRALDLLGKIHSKEGDGAKSLEYFQLAKKHNPLNIERSVNLATAYFSQGMRRRALRITENVLKSNPTYLDIVEISKLYLEHGYIRRALELLSPLEPITETARVFYICSVRLWQIGERKKCVDFLMKCMAELPSCHLFEYHLGVLFLKKKKYDQAKHFFEKSIENKSDYKPAVRCLKYVNSLLRISGVESRRNILPPPYPAN